LRKRTLIPLLIALAVLAALGVGLYLRAKAPPEAARLLPESDAIVYIQLKEIRAATHFDRTPIERTPDFQQFIDATGIQPERDLDSAAFALHRLANPNGPNGPIAYSEVFTGRFDGVKLAHYIASIAVAQETYAGRIIYTIPVGDAGRQLRIAQLGYDTLGASNMPTSEQIHSMLDRARTPATGTPGSSLLAALYHEVPLLAPVWAIGHLGLPFAEDGKITAMGLELPFQEDSDFVASMRYNATTHLLSGGQAELRIEEIAPDAATAQRTVESLNTLLGLGRALLGARPVDEDAGSSAAGSSASSNSKAKASAQAIVAILQSATVTRKNDRALFSANASLAQLKALAPAPASTSPGETAPAGATPK
jgi:hypothetical protein